MKERMMARNLADVKELTMEDMESIAGAGSTNTDNGQQCDYDTSTSYRSRCTSSGWSSGDLDHRVAYD